MTVRTRVFGTVWESDQKWKSTTAAAEAEAAIELLRMPSLTLLVIVHAENVHDDDCENERRRRN